MDHPLTPDIIEQLLRRSAWTRRAALACVRDPSLADDLEQDAFLRVLQSKSRPDRGLLAWFETILRRLAIDRAQRDRARATRELRTPPPEIGPADAELVARAELLGIVHEELLRLPEPHRRALLLGFYEDLGPAEIAQREGVPAATARSRRRRALELLRERLTTRLGSSERWRAGLGPFLTASGWTGIEGGLVLASMKTKVVAAAALVFGVAVIGGVLLRTPPESVSDSANLTVPALPSPPAPSVEPVVVVTIPPAAREEVGPPPRVVLRPRPAEALRGKDDLRGRVIDAVTREPVAGARATAVLVGRTEIAAAITDEDGVFAIDDMELRSSHDLRVIAAGYAPFDEPIDWRLKNRALGEGLLELGDFAVERGEVISGIVRKVSGVPAPGARIYVDERGSNQRFRMRDARPVAVADENGRFQARGIAVPQSSDLRIFAFAVDDAEGAHGAFLSGFGSVKLRRGGGAKDIEVRCVATTSISVIVTRSDGSPVAGASVTAEPRFEPWIDDVVMSRPDGSYTRVEPAHGIDLGPAPEMLATFRQVTDADGRASLPRLPLASDPNDPPCYDLFVAADGFSWGAIDGIELNGSGSREFSIVLAERRLHRIEGSIFLATGEPATFANAYLKRLVADTSENFEPVVADANGRFAFDAVEGGYSYTVSAMPLDHMHSTVDVDLVAKDAPDVAKVELRCEKSYTIRGRLVDQHGAGVAGAMLGVRGDKFMRRTEADGAFELHSALAGELVVCGIGFHFPVGQWKDPEPKWPVRSGDTNVTLVVERIERGACELRVEVIDATSGEPLPVDGLWLSARPEDPSRRAGSFEIAVGRAVVRELLAGRWLATVTIADRGRVEREFEIATEERSHFEQILVPAAATLRVRIAGPPAAGAASLHVGLSREVGSPTAGTVVRAFQLEPGGTAVVNALPGPLELQAMGGGFFGKTRVDVKEGETIDVTIDVVAGAKLVTTGCAALPPGDRWLSVQRDGAEWDRVGYATSRTGGEANAIVPPGKGRWRVEHAPEGGTAQIIAEGEFDAASEQIVTLVVGNH